MHVRYCIGLTVVFLLCAANTGVQAEIIKRINPDGSNTYIVPSSPPYQGAGAPEMAREREMQQAKEAYDASLERLKVTPTCTDCRQEALRLGRIFRAMARDDGKLTIYDEAALANDINAARASGGGLIPVPSGTVPSTGPSQ